MNRRQFTQLGALTPLLWNSGVWSQALTESKRRELLQDILNRSSVPAMGVALIRNHGLEWVETVGVRKKGADVQVTRDDLWHLGSCGKAMTATAIGLLVERGRLRFETPLREVFPALARRPLGDVTIEQLLSHRSGLPANASLWTMFKIVIKDTPAPMEERRMLLDKAADMDLSDKQFRYSNYGYCLAGAVIETLTKQPFEEFMLRELFAPLGMKSVGFGGTSQSNTLDQPWGHNKSGKPSSTNQPDSDNPAVLSPAGRMHMSLSDWAKFVMLHMRGATLEPEQRDASGLFTGKTFAALHRVREKDYALGWLVPERKAAGGRVLHHGGDNTTNFALVWAFPKKGVAALVTINQSQAREPANAAVESVFKEIGAV